MNKCIQEFPFRVYEGGSLSEGGVVPVYTVFDAFTGTQRRFIESLVPSRLPKGEDFEVLVRKDGVDFKCKFSDIVEAFKLVVESSDNSNKYVRTEEVLVDRSYVVEYHGYSAEDVKLLINEEF